MFTKDEIRAHLKALRTNAGLTQAALAKRLQSSPKRIANVESGLRGASMELIAQWATACGCTARLSFEPGVPTPPPQLAMELQQLLAHLPEGASAALLLQHLKLWRTACGMGQG